MNIAEELDKANEHLKGVLAAIIVERRNPATGADRKADLRYADKKLSKALMLLQAAQTAFEDL